MIFNPVLFIQVIVCKCFVDIIVIELILGQPYAADFLGFGKILAVFREVQISLFLLCCDFVFTFDDSETFFSLRQCYFKILRIQSIQHISGFYFVTYFDLDFLDGKLGSLAVYRCGSFGSRSQCTCQVDRVLNILCFYPCQLYFRRFLVFCSEAEQRARIDGTSHAACGQCCCYKTCE